MSICCAVGNVKHMNHEHVAVIGDTVALGVHGMDFHVALVSAVLVMDSAAFSRTAARHYA